MAMMKKRKIFLTIVINQIFCKSWKLLCAVQQFTIYVFLGFNFFFFLSISLLNDKLDEGNFSERLRYGRGREKNAVIFTGGTREKDCLRVLCVPQSASFNATIVLSRQLSRVEHVER